MLWIMMYINKAVESSHRLHYVQSLPEEEEEWIYIF